MLDAPQSHVNERDFLAFVADHIALSHGQLAQDLWVLWILGWKSTGYFVELGGFDGVTLSNTLLLESLGWTGVLIEPSPTHYAQAAAARSCAIVNCAVGEQEAAAAGFRLCVDRPDLSRLEAVDPGDQHESLREASHELITTPVRRMESVLAEVNAPPIIDYLSLDTEGNELDILQSFPFHCHQMRCVSVEHNFHAARLAAITEILTQEGMVRVCPDLSQWDAWFVNPSLITDPKHSSMPNLHTLTADTAAASLLPRIEAAHPSLGQHMRTRGLIDGAEQVARSLLQREPKNVVAGRLLADVANDLDDQHMLADAVAAMAEAAPQRPQLRTRAARLLLATKQPQRAIAVLEQIEAPGEADRRLMTRARNDLDRVHSGEDSGELQRLRAELRETQNVRAQQRERIQALRAQVTTLRSAPDARRLPTKRSALRTLLAKGLDVGLVIDVGIREDTAELREFFPDTRHVLFEPVQEYWPTISTNYAEIDHVLEPYAVSDQDGTVEIHLISQDGEQITHSQIGARPSSVPVTGSRQVDRIRLDSYLEAHSDLLAKEPFLLKLDVDGHETHILHGATDVLANSHVVVCEATAPVVGERIALLAEHDFILWDIVDFAYGHEQLWQVDLIFVAKELAQTPPFARTTADWFSMSGYLNHLNRRSSS